jgi:hypothetical protein
MSLKRKNSRQLKTQIIEKTKKALDFYMTIRYNRIVGLSDTLLR